MGEDGCVKPADLESVRELLDHRMIALEEKLELHVTGLKELIYKNNEEAESNHQHLEELIRLAKEEGAKAREKIDVDLRTLREGRSTDKGRQLGAQPYVHMAFSIIAAILTAALVAYFAGRSSAPPQPAATGAHR
jgi:hypothetical protein